MLYKLLFFFSIVFISFTGIGQNKWNRFPKNDEHSKDSIGKEAILADTMTHDLAISKEVAPGNIQISVSPSIVQIDEQLIKEAKNDPRIQGFTILIFSGSGANSKYNARTRQNQFKELYPEYISHLTWKSPNYEVRVGDFRTKIEAEKLVQVIKADYPSAIIRADLIELPELPAK